jgi:hypothetical protein
MVQNTSLCVRCVNVMSTGDVRGPGVDGLLVLTGIDSINPNTPGSSARRLAQLNSSSSARRLLHLFSNSSNSGSSSSTVRRLLQESSSSSRALWVETLSAQGLSGSKLLLVPSEAATASPHGHYWPGGNAPVAPPAAGLASSALAAVIAVPVVVIAALLAAAVYVIVTRQKRRQREQEGLPDGSKKGMRSGSNSSSFGSARTQHDSKGVCPAASASLCCSISEERPLRDQGVQGSAGSPATAAEPASNAAASCLVSACHLTGSTIDSAHSMSDLVMSAKQPQLNLPNTALQQQQQPSGLSHRLTSAISNLQQDITRRRILGPFGTGSSQQQQPAAASPPAPASSGSREASVGQGQSTATASPANGSQQQAQHTPTQHHACSLAAVRSAAVSPGDAGADAADKPVAPSELQILGLIGRGSFASVFRAIWRGRCVALKVVQLPASAAGDGDDDLSALQRERMAVMEAVISATMSHPNVVQVRFEGVGSSRHGTASEEMNACCITIVQVQVQVRMLAGATQPGLYWRVLDGGCCIQQ